MAGAVFWGAIGVVVYVYLGFPLAVFLVGRLRPRPVRKGPSLPTVSFIIAAYNEERVIAKKLENTLALDYPPDRLEVIVVSDGSSDRTDEIVARDFAGRVKLLALGGRHGKTAAQNRAVAVAQGEIVIFSDATTVYEPGCLRALVANFADPEVGGATGWVVMGADPDAAMHKGRSAYADYEQWLRIHESRIHSVLGTAGCILALRRSLYTPLPPEVDADVAEALKVNEQGYRVVFDDEAVVYEAGESRSIREELERRTRVIARGLRGYFYLRSFFNPLRHPWFCLTLLSHRLLRWGVPVFLIVAFAANLWLLDRSFYLAVFVAQVAFFAVAALAYVLERRNVRPPGFFIPLYFCVVNLAPLLALRALWRGETTVVWETSRS